MNKEAILSRLDIPVYYKALIPSLKVNGKAKAMALCPFHNDNNPSLSVDLNKGLFHCFSCEAGGDVFEFYQKLKNVNFPTALKEIAQMQGITDVAPKREVARFEYRDINGKVLYIKERLEGGWDSRKGKPEKTFAFKHYEGNTLIKGRGCDPVLYNLPAFIKSKYAFVVEGEGKADFLTEWGLVATCLDSGANSPWRDDYLKAFAGKEKLIILPDNDAPGQSYALRLADILYEKIGSIKIVKLPGLNEAEDIVDWAKVGGNDRAKLLEVVKASPEWRPEQDKKEVPAVRTPVTVQLNTVQPETVRWLWQDYIPLGKVTLVDGDPGLGKSIFTLDIAARGSRGTAMPDGSPAIKCGTVLLTLEDGLADTVVPRLTALGADLSMIVALQGIAYPDGTSSFPTVRDTDVIEAACKQVSAKLLIVDPLMGYLGGEVNSYRDQDIRQALSPLSHLAEKLGIAVIVIRHLNKSGGGQSIYRGGGSIGIIGAARCAYLVAKDPQDENRRVMACIKNNLAPMPPSLSFNVEGVDGASRIVWGGVSTHTADGLLAIPVSQEERSALEEAEDFLKDMLTEGPVEAKSIQKEAKMVGISDKTLQRVKKMLGIRSRRITHGFGKGGEWIWEFAQDGQATHKMVNQKDGHLMEVWPSYGNNPPVLEGD